MSYRILIVDTSATTRAVIKRTIRKAGLDAGRYFEATSAAETIDVLAHHRVDLILIDPRLPDADGLELIGRIVAEPDTRGIPIISLWTRVDNRGLQTLRRHGVAHHLRKPIDPKLLKDVAGGLLEPTHV